MVLFHCQHHFHCHISVKKEQNLLRLFFDQVKEVAHIASLMYAFFAPYVANAKPLFSTDYSCDQRHPPTIVGRDTVRAT